MRISGLCARIMSAFFLKAMLQFHVIIFIMQMSKKDNLQILNVCKL
jgi:hypothetical protein